MPTYINTEISENLYGYIDKDIKLSNQENSTFIIDESSVGEGIFGNDLYQSSFDNLNKQDVSTLKSSKSIHTYV